MPTAIRERSERRVVMGRERGGVVPRMEGVGIQEARGGEGRVSKRRKGGLEGMSVRFQSRRGTMLLFLLLLVDIVADGREEGIH